MTRQSWLVVIDMQNVFAAGSPWATTMFAEASAGVQRLLPAFSERTVFTRYVAPSAPTGAWVDYFEEWPFALVDGDDDLYQLTPEFNALLAEPGGYPVVIHDTFGKWGPEMGQATRGATELVLSGVATDCCVISTALAMADAGMRVHVVADACGGSTPANHAKALDVMALYAPLISVTEIDEVLGWTRH